MMCSSMSWNTEICTVLACSYDTVDVMIELQHLMSVYVHCIFVPKGAIQIFFYTVLVFKVLQLSLKPG